MGRRGRRAARHDGPCRDACMRGGEVLRAVQRREGVTRTELILSSCTVLSRAPLAPPTSFRRLSTCVSERRLLERAWGMMMLQRGNNGCGRMDPVMPPPLTSPPLLLVPLAAVSPWPPSLRRPCSALHSCAARCQAEVKEGMAETSGGSEEESAGIDGKICVRWRARRLRR